MSEITSSDILEEIALERQRQKEREGYNSTHDDEHAQGGEKPCPFCGHTAPILLDTGNGDGKRPIAWYVHCPDCGACGPECLNMGRAVEAWEKAPRSVLQRGR